MIRPTHVLSGAAAFVAGWVIGGVTTILWATWTMIEAIEEGAK